MRVYSLVGELVAFFHSRRSQVETHRFIGTRDSGALAALFDAYYGYLRDVWPPDVLEAMEAGCSTLGRFTHFNARDRPNPYRSRTARSLLGSTAAFTSEPARHRVIR